MSVALGLAAAAALLGLACWAWSGRGGRRRFEHRPCWYYRGDYRGRAPQGRRPHLVVMVHGIFGSDVAGLDLGNFGDWPAMLASDPDLGPRLDLRLFSYRSLALNPWDRTLTIPHHSAALREDLRAIRAADYGSVAFIVHSMGGLVLRQALLDLATGGEADRGLLDRVKAVYMLCTPNAGSFDADLLRLTGLSHQEALEMGLHSEYLRGLNRAWKRALSGRILRPGSAPARGRMLLALGAETKGIAGMVTVSPASLKALGAHTLFKAFPLNHLQMAAAHPDNRAVYDWVKRGLGPLLAAGPGRPTFRDRHA